MAEPVALLIGCRFVRVALGIRGQDDEHANALCLGGLRKARNHLGFPLVRDVLPIQCNAQVTQLRQLHGVAGVCVDTRQSDMPIDSVENAGRTGAARNSRRRAGGLIGMLRQGLYACPGSISGP